MSERYITKTAPRTTKPANTKHWYRCVCGRWWGKNKHFRCTCGELPPSFKRRRDRTARFG